MWKIIALGRHAKNTANSWLYHYGNKGAITFDVKK